MWECGRGEKEGGKVAHCTGTVSGKGKKLRSGILRSSGSVVGQYSPACNSARTPVLRAGVSRYYREVGAYREIKLHPRRSLIIESLAYQMTV